jgi:hypothetical protein
MDSSWAWVESVLKALVVRHSAETVMLGVLHYNLDSILQLITPTDLHILAVAVAVVGQK